MKRKELMVICVISFLVGCGPKAYVRQGFMDHPPRRVAVLPFVITYAYDLAPGEAVPEAHRIGRDVFRTTFYHTLAPYGYEDVKPADVDAKLAAAYGPLDAGAWRAATPQQLAQTLGVDALVFGEISRIMHVSTPLYTESSLTAQLRMVDAATGETLWRTRVHAADRGGALVQKGQVVDFDKDQARSEHPEVKFLRVADAAIRQAFAKFPNPPMTAAGLEAPRAEAGAVRLAILPFGAAKKNFHEHADALRKSLAANLTDGPFTVLELQEVDAALADLGWHEENPQEADRALLQAAQKLGVDAFVRGTVTTWGRTYLIAESWVKAGLTLELVDAQTGDVIWSEDKTNTRQSGILKGPTDYNSIVTAPIMGMKTSRLNLVADHLTRGMAQDLVTAPSVLTYLSEHTKQPSP